MTVQTNRRVFSLTAVAALVSAAPLIAACGGTKAQAATLPAPAVDATSTKGLQKVVLAGGCFWGVQAVFQQVKGVTSAVSGYSGGEAKTAHYEMVGRGNTGHAESVEVTYDPTQISFGEILRIFFSVATDPTQLNMQFPDEGPQYRNEIFVTSDEQARVARAYIAQLDKSGAFRKPIVTKVSMLKGFYPAEDYHQDYLVHHPKEPYIVMYDQPKLQELRRQFPNRWRGKPLLASR